MLIRSRHRDRDLAEPPRPRSRRRIASWLLAFVLVVPLVGGIGGAPQVARGDDLAAAQAQQRAISQRIAAQKAEIARLGAQQATLNGVIADTAQALNAVNADLVAVQRKIDALARQIAAVRATYLDLVAQLADLDRQLADIQEQEATKADELSQRKGILAGRLRAAYATDRTSALEVILSAGSFVDALTNMGYLLDFGGQDTLLAGQIRDDQAALATLHQTVADTRAQTNDLRVRTVAQKKRLDAALATQRGAQARLAGLKRLTAQRLATQQANYAKLARNKAAAAKAIREAEAAERSLQRKIDALIAAQRQAGSIPSIYNGTLSWPMVGSVTQEFGCTGFPWEPPLGACGHYHNGMDFAGPMYTPIRAAGDGRVVFAGANPYDSWPKAWIVIIAHSGSLQTWYAHLDNGSHSIPVSAGQWVTKGQIIGYEGMTGHTTGPHLHFMVELNGTFVNPRLFM